MTEPPPSTPPHPPPPPSMSPSPDHSSASSMFCQFWGEGAGEAIINRPSPPPPPPLPPIPDEETIAGLIDAETRHMPKSDYFQRCCDNSVDISKRLDAITWILKVHAFYEFRPVTAFLSVNYLDRFLSRASLPRSSYGWAFQLLSVACLSLAAKMEEPRVPLLMDLQLFEPRFLFEPKTIQKMEVWIMATLNWRLRSVTPFDYLDYFISKLPSSSSSSSSDTVNRFVSTASDLIISTTHVVEFARFAPSTVAAAAVLCSAGNRRDAVSESPLCFHDRVNQEMVRCCHQLMEEYMVDTCLASRYKVRRPEPAPPSSPIGVLDAATCASCDTRSETNSGGGGSSEEPENKRLRTSAPDVPDDGR